MSTTRFTFSLDAILDADIMLWLERQPNASAAVREALRDFVIKPTLAQIDAKLNLILGSLETADAQSEPSTTNEIGIDDLHLLKISREQKAGHVYLLKAGPYYKIGISAQVDERIKQLSVLPPFDIELIHAIYDTNMYALEKDLHERFAPKRKNGEWFELDDSDVEYIKGL